MLLDEFKRRLTAALGGTLEHATPANVREFVDEIQLELWREERPKPKLGEPALRIELEPGAPASYESVMRNFFVHALTADRDKSLIHLWVLALDLAYSGIEDLHSERMTKLFESDSEERS